MNIKTWTILCVLLWMAMLARSWHGAVRADDAPDPSQNPSKFQPGDNIVIRQPTALRAGTETLAWLAPGTHLVVGKVNSPWLV